jgi:hypothetical protein
MDFDCAVKTGEECVRCYESDDALLGDCLLVDETAVTTAFPGCATATDIYQIGFTTYCINCLAATENDPGFFLNPTTLTCDSCSMHDTASRSCNSCHMN